jgi:hypothetical protein
MRRHPKHPGKVGGAGGLSRHQGWCRKAVWRHLSRLRNKAVGDPKHTEFLSVAFLDFALNRRDANPGRVKLIFGCLSATIALWALDMVALSFKLLGEGKICNSGVRWMDKG